VISVGPLLRVACNDQTEWLALKPDALRADHYPALCRVSADGAIEDALALQDAPVHVDRARLAAAEEAFRHRTSAR
jgi:hypothetical protein